MIRIDAEALKTIFKMGDSEAEQFVTRYLRTASKILWDCNTNPYAEPPDGDALFFSTSQLRDKLSSKQVDGKRVMYWDAIKDVKGLSLFSTLKKGTNLHRQYSEVQLHVDKHDLMRIAGDPDSLIEQFLAGVDLNAVHWVDVDQHSLSSYIHKLRQQQGAKAYSNLLYAHLVYAIASKFDWKFPQQPIESQFGRQYYAGKSLQNCRTEIRQAVLGHCWQYDLNTAAYAVMLHEAEKLWEKHFPGNAEQYPFTKQYIANKAEIRKQLARVVYGNDSEQSVAVIKNAFVAIGFGAKGNANAWQVKVNGKSTGKLQQSAIRSVFNDKQDAQMFLDDDFVKAFIAEQEDMGKFIYDMVKNDAAFLAQVKDIADMRYEKGNMAGKLKKSKVLAFIYQTKERELLDAMTALCSGMLLRVHDGFYTRTQQDLAALNAALASNPYLRVDEKELVPVLVPVEELPLLVITKLTHEDIVRPIVEERMLMDALKSEHKPMTQDERFRKLLNDLSNPATLKALIQNKTKGDKE